LVMATEASTTTPTSQLIQGWYASGSTTLDKNYLPPAWQAAEAATPGAAQFYHAVVGSACRTCHASLGANFDWDRIVLSPARASTWFCGGQSDVAIDASMPNALISSNRVAQRVQADPTLAPLLVKYLGCSAQLPDPVYPKR
ncbi:MAG: hypothetical protein KGL43_00585, partial [Burkholderiales bacterium]|nr:hypothetical protein [Burkholderiales bacterium]